MIENFDNKYLQSFEYETTAISDGNIIGTCELGKATIQMINDSNKYSSLKGQWIKTIHGSFYIYDVEPVQEKVNIKLSCYDVKYKLDTDYDSSLYTWPMTLKEWRNQIGTNCGITFDNSDFPNSDLVLEEEPYIGENPSNRNVICLIAQAGCSFVDTDSSNIFYFRWFDDTVYTVNDWLELTTEKEYSNPINVMVLGRGDVEDNVYYPETLPNNPVEFRIENNYILDPQDNEEDKRYSVIQPIYNRVNGFSYLKFNMRAQQIDNKLNIKLGQKVFYIDLWGNELTAYIMYKKLTWLGGEPTISDNYEITLSAEEIKETATEYTYAASVERRLLTVERTTNKQDGIITDLISDVSESSKKINQLQMTSESTISKISSVEKEFNTNVNNLQTQINGVNANFEDFKDNEYIQSIDNLQKQIDGAIQFWNGAEIPTVSNYPANEWTTENDKINHQADIYTVIQDVEGEMKQGKSYRFDKVGGVWQWIELTDNELSAVQAIAQEALNKANTNTSDISSLKSSVSTLEQTDKSIKASVETINNQIIPTSQVSSSNISIEDSAEAPLINFEIEGKSIQEISDQPSEIKSVGYENLANTNKRNGIYNATTGVFNDNNNYLANVDIVSVKPNTNYIFNSNLDYLFEAYLYDSNKNYIGRAFAENNKFTTTSETYYINWRTLTSGQSDLNCEVLLTEGTKQHSYIPQGKYGIEVEITNGTDNYTLLFILEQPLRSLPNGVRDLAYIKNNTLYVDRKIGKHIFKKVSTLSLHSNGLYYGTNALSTLGINTTDILSDKILGGYYEENKGYVVGNGTTFVIFGNSSETIESFNDKYVGAEIYYPIAEPYIETIGELEMPSTFKGVSNITTTDELEPVINIEYVRDTTLSGYVERQLQNERVIREESIAQLIIEDNEIKESVSSVSTDLASANTTINKVEETLTSQEKTIQIIFTNIDQTTGAVKEVTTTNGFTFNHKGLKIYTDENSYNTQIDNVGTYYKDGDEVIGQTTKDGSLLKNLNQQGQSQYSYDNINEIYDFVEERIEVDGEYAYATFYNGEE